MAITEIILTDKQIVDVLYYETGFEQMHPHREVVEWMEELGWKYRSDWACFHSIVEYGHQYKLWFHSEEIATAFILKWL